MARRLVELPYLCEKFSAGLLSYSKARAIARVATGRNEVALVDSALSATAAQIERLTRGMGGRADRGPASTWKRVAKGDLAAAVVAVAEMVCAMDSAPVHSPAAEVWVHVDTSGAVGELSARIDDGPALSISDTERIGCAAWIRRAGHARDGRTTDLGRRNRRPSGRLLAVLHRRDRGCAAPGCGRTRFLHAHHVRPWASGGRTNPDNVIMLCGEHHRAVHNEMFSIVALGRQQFRFHGPNGIRTSAAPAVGGTLSGLQKAIPDVSPDAIVPNWDGQHLDLDWAVACLLQ